MFAVAYIPQFSLQAVLRHEPELWAKPVALVDPAARAPVLCEMTETARAAGLAEGLTPTQAMARCRDVLIRSRSLAQETAATTALIDCAYGFSPHLEATAPGVCTLDLRGLAVLAETGRAALENWARQFQAVLSKVQLSASMGVGATPNLARQAARWGRGIEVIENTSSFMEALPVTALEPSMDVALLLQRWGIRTVGELLALGQDALANRLGLEALSLFAAASSTALRPLHLIYPTERFEEFFEFQPEVEMLEPLLFLLRRFVDQLTQRLESRGLIADSLDLQLVLESGENMVCRLRLPQPTRQADVLFRTLNTYLETLRTSSAIKSVGLTIIPTEGAPRQLGLFETVLVNPLQFQETLARLSALLGPDRVGTPQLENSHRADAFHLAPPDFENAAAPVETGQTAVLAVTPLRRFRPAVRAEVQCSDRPLSISCAVKKGALKITLGPWRSSGRWWEAGGWEREEWDAATQDGQVIRLVHQPEGWFVEGIVD